MKYITAVHDRSGAKHIVEVNSKNLEVIKPSDPEAYGNKKGVRYFTYGDIKVYTDLTFKVIGSDSNHLAEIVFAIELVRFVIEELKAKGVEQ
ncbi:hypothetical protein NVP1151O_57 [Vibrio phage 1.151.O._10N.222.46.B1]|nr:hypothetical protein NVP1151O_57 [Vibrio phage 1.151.O._10N.222.46.B1]